MPLRPQSLREWRELTQGNPILVAKYLRSYVQHRILAPLVSVWRPGAVAVFHVGRCGSTVLSDLLSQHPGIYWDGESYVRVIQRLQRAAIPPGTAGFDPPRYIARRLSRSGWRWFGYDLKIQHIREFAYPLQTYIENIEALGVEKLVVLRRRNLLRRMVSASIGKKRGRYHLPASVPTAELMTIRIDPVKAAEAITTLEADYAALDRALGDRSVLRLAYEEDVSSDPSLGALRALEHLGLPPCRFQVRIQKTTPFPLRATIENFEEFRAVFRDTPHSWMLEDDS